MSSESAHNELSRQIESLDWTYEISENKFPTNGSAPSISRGNRAFGRDVRGHSIGDCRWFVATLYASLAASGLAFITAFYAAALIFRRVVSASTNSMAPRSVSVEEGQSDIIDQTSTTVRRGVAGTISLICLIAVATNVRAIFREFDPLTLAAIAITASCCIISSLAIVSLSLVGRRNLTLALIIGNLVCLVLALISFIMKPTLLAISVAVWCASAVILPLLKVDLWWNRERMRG